MAMIIYGIMITGALFIFMAGRWVARAYEEGITGWVFACYISMLALVTAIVLIVCVQFDPRTLFVILVLWIPGLYEMSKVIAYFASRVTVVGLFLPSMKSPVRTRLGRMKALLLEGDVAGATAACLNAFNEHPDDVETLLDGARLLAGQGHYEEAVAMYTRVMDEFPLKMEAWSQAAWQTAVIYEEYLHDVRKAKAVLTQLIRHAPRTELGRRAGARLQREILAGGLMDDDPFFRGKKNLAGGSDPSDPTDPAGASMRRN